MARIFLVDDHPDVREVMGHLLEMHGHKVEVITSGEAALQRLAGECPDVVIADQRLPGISGVDLLKNIRRDNRLANICCVLFSADDNMRDPALEAGANSFWLKGSDTLFDSIAQLDSLISNGKALQDGHVKDGLAKEAG
jgi:CheY-like chemotaxis protein